MAKRIILASSSFYRVDLLRTIGYKPDIIMPADIDETPYKKELPNRLALRLSQEKAVKISKNYFDDLVLAADTVTAVGREILPKVMNEKDARYCIQKLSGRRHRVYSGVSAIYQDKMVSKIGMNIIAFKRLSQEEIELFIQSKDWFGKAGGYSIQGLASLFIKYIRGSHSSNVIGIPLHETYNILNSFGFTPNI